jgi:hypothetical protein
MLLCCPYWSNVQPRNRQSFCYSITRHSVKLTVILLMSLYLFRLNSSWISIIYYKCAFSCLITSILMIKQEIVILKYHHHQSYQCPHCWGTGRPYGLHIRRTGHNPPRGSSVGWWVILKYIQKNSGKEFWLA